MIYNKNNLIIHQIADQTGNRPEISGIFFKKDKTVATDSYKLIEVKNPDEMLNADIPIIADGSKLWQGFVNKGVIIPSKAVQKILQNLKEIKRELPVLQNCWFSDKSNQENSEIITTDLEIVNKVQTKNISCEYPNYNDIIPQTNNGFTKIILHLDFLIKLLNTIGKMDLADKNIELFIKNSETPLVIKTTTVQKQQITALLMPIKS